MFLLKKRDYSLWQLNFTFSLLLSFALIILSAIPKAWVSFFIIPSFLLKCHSKFSFCILKWRTSCCHRLEFQSSFYKQVHLNHYGIVISMDAQDILEQSIVLLDWLTYIFTLSQERHQASMETYFKCLVFQLEEVMQWSFEHEDCQLIRCLILKAFLWQWKLFRFNQVLIYLWTLVFQDASLQLCILLTKCQQLLCKNETQEESQELCTIRLQHNQLTLERFLHQTIINFLQDRSRQLLHGILHLKVYLKVLNLSARLLQNACISNILKFDKWYTVYGCPPIYLP